MWNSRFWLRRVLPVSVIILLLLIIFFWGSADAPNQSPACPFGLKPITPVQRAGSDWASTWFLIRWLPTMMDLANVRLQDNAAKARFSELVLDPTRLKLAETTDVRIYFVGEDSGKRNSLGINLDGIGIDEGNPSLIFPESSSANGLHSIAKAVGKWKSLFSFAVIFARKPLGRDFPLMHGDFVDLGIVEAGTTLNFFLVGDGAQNDGNADRWKEVFTTHPEKNVDKVPHAVAIALENSPYLLLSFEDLYGGGDRDYSDCVFAVKMSNYNVAALLGDIDPWYRVKQMIKLGITLFIFVGIPVGSALARFLLRWLRLRKELKRAKELRNKGGTEDALTVIDHVKKKYFGKRIRGEWKQLEFEILEDIHDSAGLEGLLERSGSDDFYNREKASLLVSQSLLVNERLDTLGELREQWRGKERDVQGWKEIEARLLNQQGRHQEVEMQFGADLTHTEDHVGLMVQVAEAVKHRSVQEAQQLLAASVQQAPNNPEVCLGLGQFHEQANALDKAEQAYQRALKLARRNPLIIHEVGEFYRRQTRYKSALQIWSQALERPSLHVLWTKCLFWQKVAIPFPINWQGLTPPEGHLLPMIQALQEIGENEFWNVEASQHITKTNPGLLERQEIYWLRLLDAFLSGKEDRALMLLNTQMFGDNSWHSLLEIMLLRVLTYRRNGFLTPFDNTIDVNSYPLKNPKLFAAIIQFSRGTLQEETKSLIALVQSKGIYARLFSDAGWTQAAKILASSIERIRG